MKKNKILIVLSALLAYGTMPSGASGFDLTSFIESAAIIYFSLYFFKFLLRAFIKEEFSPNSRTNQSRRQFENNLRNSLYNGIVGSPSNRNADAERRNAQKAAAWHRYREQQTRGTSQETYHKYRRWDAEARSKRY